MERARGDRGQAVPLLAAVLAVALVALVGVGRLAGAAVAAARARTAADAAALAGAHWGRPAAARAAAENGGVLVAYRQQGADVVVAVVVDGAEASARATLVATPRGP